ncbi:VOC family protein [Actinopolymorpha sp. B11F2]|uniref:VOC family protein n=1 Tax=Actinopolymorpha sp. B11F2 TaxID=3160862 RepID=UPI0032E37BA0
MPEPKVVKNRLHLDIKVGQGLPDDDRRAMDTAKVAELTALGATPVEAFPSDGGLVVLGDPEDNEFCVT